MESPFGAQGPRVPAIFVCHGERPIGAYGFSLHRSPDRHCQCNAGFSLERHVPDNHLLRRIDRFVDLSAVRAHLEPYYSEVGRPSIDSELMMRMLIVGYCFGIRSERRLPLRTCHTASESGVMS